MKIDPLLQPPRASFQKQIFLCAFISLSLFTCSILFASHTLVTISFVSTSRTSFFLLCSLNLDTKSESLKLQEKCSMLFSYFILEVLLSWSCYLNIYSTTFMENNSVGIIFVACCLIIIEILLKKRKMNEIKSGFDGLCTLSGLICLFCGLASWVLDESAIIDVGFSMVFAVFMFLYVFVNIFRTLPEVLFTYKELNEKLYEILTDVIEN